MQNIINNQELINFSKNLSSEKKTNIFTKEKDSFEKIMQSLDKDSKGMRDMMLKSLESPDILDPKDKTGDMINCTVAIMNIELAKHRAILEKESKESDNLSSAQLLDKEVCYDNSQFFDGNNSVAFKYNVQYPEKYSNENISIKIHLKDRDENIIYSTNGNRELGNHKFIWNGYSNNNKREKMPEGTYFIEVTGTGNRVVNGEKIPFEIITNSSDIAIVKSIEIAKNRVEKLVLNNGEKIDKNQITHVQNHEIKNV